jgi:membrane protein
MDRRRNRVRLVPDGVRHGALVLQDALGAFFRDGGLRNASSLAFYTLLALIPALLLLTLLLSMILGSSAAGSQILSESLSGLAPDQADRVLTELSALTRHPRTAGALNLLALTWSVVPLVSALRAIVRGIYRVRERRAFWITKLLDLATGMVALTSLAALGGASTLLRLARVPIPGLETFLGLLVTLALVTATFRTFAPSHARMNHLLTGAVATIFLWAVLRPAFTRFLVLDQNYGVAFGSFKSLFVVVVWLYVSMAVLLLGLEVAAACHRREAVTLHRLMDGTWKPDTSHRHEFLMDVPEGHLFFREGDPGEEMYYIMEGTVAIHRGGLELARIGPGRFFGEMTFLLGRARSAGAVAAEPCRCVVIHARNFDQLLAEFPDTIRGMLVEMASRLEATSGLAQAEAEAERAARRMEVLSDS